MSRVLEDGEIKSVKTEYRLMTVRDNLDQSNPALNFLAHVSEVPTYSESALEELRDKAIEWGFPKKQIWIEEREHIITSWKVVPGSVTEIVNADVQELDSGAVSGKISSR